MTNSDSIESSKALYEKAKSFFVAKNLPDCVIEISDRPFEEWIVHLTPTGKQQFSVRDQLASANKPFIAIYKGRDGLNYFFLTDNTITTLQVVETNEMLISDIEDSQLAEDMDEIRKEFAELMMLLQNE